jgi:hypothetical protein
MGMGESAMRPFMLDEQETTFTIDATNRELVRVYSNDPVFIAKLKKIGAVVHRECSDGGIFYDLRSDQFLLRKGKRKMSPAQKVAAETALAKATKVLRAGK